MKKNKERIILGFGLIYMFAGLFSYIVLFETLIDQSTFLYLTPLILLLISTAILVYNADKYTKDELKCR